MKRASRAARNGATLSTKVDEFVDFAGRMGYTSFVFDSAQNREGEAPAELLLPAAAQRSQASEARRDCL